MDLENLEKRLSAIESRLTHIENKLQTESPSSSSTLLSTKEKIRAARATPQSSNWLGFIAMICFIFAAAFIIKLSLETGWLTPTRQIGLAALLGLMLIGAGIILLEKDRKYASLLPAAGIIVLYLTAFAAHRWYALISFAMAVAATSMISGLCILLYSKIKDDIYAMAASIGAYVSPLLLGFNATALFSLYYFLVCSITFTMLSVLFQARALIILSAYLAVLATCSIGVDLPNDALIAIILALQFLIFLVGTLFYSYYTNVILTKKESWYFFPLLLIFYGAEFTFIERAQPGLTPWISLGFIGLVAGLYLAAKKIFLNRYFNSQAMMFAFISLVFFHSIYLRLLPSNMRPWLFVLIIMSFALLPQKHTQQISHSYRIPTVVILIILSWEYIKMFFHVLFRYQLSWLTVLFASCVSLWCLFLFKRNHYDSTKRYDYLLLSAAHLLAIVGLFRLTDGYGSLAVSASWLFYALFVISFAFRQKDKVLAKSAILILTLAAAKALLLDASSAPTIIRILCLLLTGSVLYGAGFLLRKISMWGNR